MITRKQLIEVTLMACLGTAAFLAGANVYASVQWTKTMQERLDRQLSVSRLIYPPYVNTMTQTWLAGGDTPGNQVIKAYEHKK